MFSICVWYHVYKGMILVGGFMTKVLAIVFTLDALVATALLEVCLFGIPGGIFKKAMASIITSEI